MDKPKDEFQRNLPSDEGRRGDPHRREESGQQPGVSTYSTSENDQDNQELTKTASDQFREEPFGENADAGFDEVDKRDELENRSDNSLIQG